MIDVIIDGRTESMQGRGRRHSTRIKHKLGRGTCENIEYAYIYIASSVIIDNLKIYDYGHTIYSTFYVYNHQLSPPQNHPVKPASLLLLNYGVLRSY
jgi:hypothetical protein